MHRLGYKNLHKRFDRVSLEEQVEKKQSSSSTKEIITTEEENALDELTRLTEEMGGYELELETKKKKTANDIHREIKSLVAENQLQEARLVLKQALQDGYKGKRLSRWSSELLEDEEVGNRTRNLWKREDFKELAKLNSAARVDTNKIKKEKQEKNGEEKKVELKKKEMTEKKIRRKK